jgi:hypothetical protein
MLIDETSLLSNYSLISLYIYDELTDSFNPSFNLEAFSPNVFFFFFMFESPLYALET